MKKKITLTLSLFVGIVATISLSFKSETTIGTDPATPIIHWYTLEQAQHLSDSMPRKIFIDFTTSWCGWCKTMDQNTFQNPIIAKYMDANYYCVKFNAETRDTVTFNGQKFANRGAENQRSANDFTITALQGRLSYPSFTFVSKDRKNFTIMAGYMPPEQFEPYLHYYSEEKELTVPYEEYLKTFKSELPKKETAPKPIGPPQN